MDAAGDIELQGAVKATAVVILNAGSDLRIQNGALLSAPGDA